MAEGRPAVDGKHEELVWDEVFQKQAADWQGDSRVNYYSVSMITTVEKGDVIGTIGKLVPSR